MKMNSSSSVLYTWKSIVLCCFGWIAFGLPVSSEAALTSEVFTDTDGDTYQVVLTGPGTFNATRVDTGGGNGPLDTITLSGTTTGSVLKIVVTPGPSGDEKVSFKAIVGTTPLKSISAAKSDIVGAGINLPGAVSAITVGNIGQNAAITSGVNPKVKSLKVTAGTVGAGFVGSALGQTLTFTTLDFAAASLSAKNFGALKITAGGFVGAIEAANKLVSLSIVGGNFNGRINALAIGPIKISKDAMGTGGSIVNSTIASATRIGAITLAGDLLNSQILAGARLGTDGVLGGADAASDTFDKGSIGTIKVGGSMLSVIVGAGLTPLDGVFGDSNDGIFGGKASKLGAVTVVGTVSGNTRIGAGVLGAVKFTGVKVNPKLDPRFVLKRLLKGTVAPAAATLAKAVDQTIPTNLADAVSFIFAGKPPIQTGVKKGTIKPDLAAVVRGIVRNRSGVQLDGVTITVIDHPEFGETHTQADGSFDLVVNGGSVYNFQFEADGYVPVQRRVTIAAQQFTMLEPIALSTADEMVTKVDFGAGATGLQTHEASVQDQGVHQRQGMLMFSPGTNATVVGDDGSTAPMQSLNIRATELTVGADGPNAMPGALPPNSAYTYCIDFSADEASAMGANSVEFDQPVWFYVENFLGFNVGIDVPNGFFNKAKSQWEAGPSGRIIKIISITGNPAMANLDVDGGDDIDTGTKLTDLQITDAERQRLAMKYAPGTSLWRVPIPHFSSWDMNWPFGPPPDSEPPGGGPPGGGNEDPDDPNDPTNVDIQSQVLRAQVAIAGTNFTLNYRSNRTAGWKVANRVRIPLSGTSVPNSLKRIDLEVQIAGRMFNYDFSPGPNKDYTFEWDGLDAYGRVLQGRQKATIRIGFTYDGDYQRSNRFGYNGNGIQITGDKTRQEVTLNANYEVMLGSFDNRRGSIGGWTLSQHHVYDPSGRILYQGDGRKRSVQSINRIITTVAGTGEAGFSGDGGPATEAKINTPSGVAIGPDGSLYIGDGGNFRVRKVDRKGIITTYAGTGGHGDPEKLGDGGPATKAQVIPYHLRTAPDGSLLVNGFDARIRRIDLQGMITTLIGSGVSGSTDLDVPVANATIDGSSVAVPANDGTTYIAQFSTARIRALKPDGTVTLIAGGGGGGDNSPAITAGLSPVTDLALGPCETVWLPSLGANTLRQIGANGFITRVAGGGNPPSGNGDGGPAIDARLDLSNGSEMANDAKGNVYFTQRNQGLIRRVGTDGIITTVAGNGIPGSSGDGGPALAAQIGPSGFTIAPDGSIYLCDFSFHRVRRVAPPLPGFDGQDFAIPAEDGRQLFRFDATGRHLSTVDALTGAVIWKFAYDSDGQLAKVSDASGNTTTIQRTAAGAPTAIVGPFGQKTTLGVDANGSLSSVTDALGHAYTFVVDAKGLLQSETDPLGNGSNFSYEAASGRLLTADVAGPNSLTLSRTGVGSGYFVTVTKPSGLESDHQVVNPSVGGENRQETDSLGLATTESRGENGTRTTMFPNGAKLELTYAADPRLGLQAPFEAKRVFTSPGNKVLTLERTNTVDLKDPNDPLSLISQTRKLTINGKQFTRVYQAATRTATSTSPLGRTSSRTLDIQGRMVQAQVANFSPAKYAYDGRNRLASVATGTGAGARLVKFGYDAAGRLAVLTDPLGGIERLTYDAVGRLTTKQRADDGAVAFGYDHKGRRTSLTPPGKNAHLLDYAPDNILIGYTAPDAGSGTAITTFVYDADRRLSQIDRPNGSSIAFGYDAKGQLATRTRSATDVTTFAYDVAKGTPTTVTQFNGDSITLTHDGAIPLGETWAGTVVGSVTQTIDNNLRTATQSVNGGSTIALSYDNDGLLLGAGDLALTRDLTRGVVLSASLGSVSDTRTYNDFGEVASYSASANGQPLYSAVYTRDKNGRLTRLEEVVGAGAGVSYDYRYDETGRLIERKQGGAVQATHSYTYDANGNRLTADGVTSAYDAQDRLTALGTIAYAYNTAGDRLTRTDGANVTATTYDASGNLTGVTLPDSHQITYTMDGRDRRIRRAITGGATKAFLYLDARRVVAELDGSNNLVSRFVYADRAEVPAYMVKGGQTYRIIADHLGSVRVVVNAASGTVAQQIDYDPFGQVLNDTNPGFQPFGFAGGLYDPETKLVRFGQRDYDPEAGRWTNKDPIFFDGGDTNLYAYVNNDPVNTTDPSGLFLLPKPITDPDGNYIFPNEADKIKYLQEYYDYIRDHPEAKVSGPPLNISFPDGAPPEIVPPGNLLSPDPLPPSPPITMDPPSGPPGSNPNDGSPIIEPPTTPDTPPTPIGGGSGIGGLGGSNYPTTPSKDKAARPGLRMPTFR